MQADTSQSYPDMDREIHEWLTLTNILTNLHLQVFADLPGK